MRGKPLERAAAALVSRPVVYGIVQALAGQARVAARLNSAVAALGIGGAGGSVLDVGSAEGGFAARVGIDPVYIDVDARPLLALRRRDAKSRAAAADASRLPFEDGAFDVTLCVAVSHHLAPEVLEGAVSELARVTRRRLVFLDAVRDDGRRLSRWLWKLDRGRYPRTQEDLGAALARRFRLDPPANFTVLHRYVLWVATPI